MKRRSKQNIAYLLANGLFTGVFVAFVLIIVRLLSAGASIDSFKISIATAIIIAMLFNPLRKRIQLSIDRYFLKKTYDYYGIIQKVSRDLAMMFDLRKIYSFIGDIIYSSLALKNVFLLVANPDGSFRIVYHVLHDGDKDYRKSEDNGVKKDTTEYTKGFKIYEDSTVIKHLKNREGVITKDELPSLPFNGEAVVPVVVDNNLELLIILGGKISGDSFTDEDVKLLDAISNQTAIAIKNTRLYKEKLLSERFASLGLMAATFAHEIRNPLTSIKTFVQLFPEKHSDVEFRDTFSKVVMSDIEKIDGLIGDFLNFSEKRTLARIDKLNIASLVDDAIEYVKNRSQLENKKINVEKFYKNVKIIIRGDSNQLKQALINIIRNGCQAMDNGGTLSIRIACDNKKVNISITDTGQGIPLQDIDRIFDPFYTTKSRGIGLGLAISKAIIEEHGGKIMVESELLKGTTFTISLPITNSTN